MSAGKDNQYKQVSKGGEQMQINLDNLGESSRSKEVESVAESLGVVVIS